MKNILYASFFELQNLLSRKSTYLVAIAYILFSLVICLSEWLRESYFSLTESMPVTLYNFILPFALVLILMNALSPIFAGDRERGIEQIPATCLIGRRGRSLAKLIGSFIFSLIISVALVLITFIICFLCWETSSRALIRNIHLLNEELSLDPVWTVFQHTGFSAISLTVGCVLVTLLVLLISCCTKNTLSAVSVSGTIILFEYLINKFSFPTIIQKYNIWAFLQPYYLFVLEIFRASPLINLLILTLAFSPLCMFVGWYILRNGV